MSQRLFLIFFCALFLRVGYVVLHQRPVQSDELEYHLLAKGLAEHQSYSVAGQPTAFRPPGYPFLVAAVYFIGGPYPILPRLIQAILDSLTAVLVFLLARPYGKRNAFLAAGCWAVFLPAVLYTGLLMSETVYVFLLVLSAVVLLRWEIGPSSKVIVAGLALGLAILIKPGTLIFVFFLLLLFRKEKLLPKHSPTFVAAVLLIVAPWVVRNYLLFERTMISSNTGVNLFIGHNPEATGGYRKLTSPEVIESSRDEKEFDSVSRRLALEYIAGNPHRVLINGFKKLAHFFGTEGELLVWSFVPRFTDPTTRFAAKYSSLPLILVFVANASYAILLLSGLAGWLGQQDNLARLFLMLFASLLAVHLIFFGGSRFHFPLMPFCAVYTAFAALDGKSILAAMGFQRKILLGFMAFSLIALWTAELIYVYTAF